MKFTINRSNWRCGSIGPHLHGKGETCMLNQFGQMCCLGHIGRQLGYTPVKMLKKSDPADVPDETSDDILRKKLEGVWKNTELAEEAISINDDESLTDEVREEALIALFAAHGHEIEFTGSY